MPRSCKRPRNQFFATRLTNTSEPNPCCNTPRPPANLSGGRVAHKAGLSVEGEGLLTGPNPLPIQWHSDGSYYERPSHAALLQPAILASLGGDTLWASTNAALSDSLRRSLGDLRALHSAGTQGECVHPVVRVDPATGRRGLFVNRLFVKQIVGLDDTESRNLLELLFSHLASPEFQIRFRWTPDIVAVWDNRFAQHFAVRDYKERRRMHRIALAGERPLGPADV
ncbi:MAG: TauD/TfdA family dioxygenase [Myxococcales bacterium]|nr:TauD/TfdA family dioxygenase [Myxococcales bacterium]